MKLNPRSMKNTIELCLFVCGIAMMIASIRCVLSGLLSIEPCGFLFNYMFLNRKIPPEILNFSIENLFPSGINHLMIMLCERFNANISTAHDSWRPVTLTMHNTFLGGRFFFRRWVTGSLARQASLLPSECVFTTHHLPYGNFARAITHFLRRDILLAPPNGPISMVRGL